MHPHPSHPKYRPDIDGLRAVAVLSVVAFHAFPSWMKGGFIGVDIFFVISGFLISTIIFENLDKETFSFADFYARRIKRIFPALLFVLIASFVFGWFALLGDEYMQLGKHIAAGTGFVSNLVLWSEAGYFDNSAETKPLLHLWSLGIEEQFYILWPFLCWFVWRLKLNIIGVTVFLLIISFALNVYGITSDAVATFYSPLTRFWELLFGSFLAWIGLYKKNRDLYGKNIEGLELEKVFLKKDALYNIASIVGALLLAYGFLKINKDLSFPGFWALIPVFGAVLIISAGSKAWFNRIILSNKIVVWFGLISFPLYLWHWPLLSFFRIVERGSPDRLSRIIAVALSILLAWLTYRFIELKVRRSESTKFVLPLITLSILVLSSGAYLFSQSGIPSRSAVVNSDFNEEVRTQFMGPLWVYTKNDICLQEYPYKDADKLAWWFCMKSNVKPPTILLLGNSYTNQLYPGFANNPMLAHHTVLSIGTCGVAVDRELNDPRNPCYGNRAKEQAEFIDNLIKDTPSIKFVILDGLSREPSGEYIDRVRKRINFLEDQGIQVIAFTPHLKPDFHPKSCFKTPLKGEAKDCSFSDSERTNLALKFNSFLVEIGKSNPKVLFFEQNDIFCETNDGKCSFVKDGLPLNRDEGHTSEYASVSLHKYFTKWAMENVPSIFDADFVAR